MLNGTNNSMIKCNEFTLMQANVAMQVIMIRNIIPREVALGRDEGKKPGLPDSN